jgi:transglutaminase-like putative cysteine protease
MAACSRAAAAFAFAAAWALFAATAHAQRVPLYVLELTVTADAPPDPARPLRLRLFSDAPAQLAKRLGDVVSVGADHVVVDASATSVLSRGAPDPPRATFVVDYDAEPVVRMREELVRRSGSAPSNADLVAFVRDRVAPSNARAFDIASQVASHRSGDCTEHAVLLVALARSIGLPARIAVGTLIAREDGALGAFGTPGPRSIATAPGASWMRRRSARRSSPTCPRACSRTRARAMHSRSCRCSRAGSCAWKSPATRLSAVPGMPP